MKTTIQRLIGLVTLGLMVGGCATGRYPAAMQPASGSATITPSCFEQPGDEWAPYFKDQPEDLVVPVEKNSAAKLKATARSASGEKVQYRWFKGLQPLPFNDETVLLKPVTFDSAGFYVCQASILEDSIVHSTCSRLAEVQVYTKSTLRERRLAALGGTNLTTIATVTVSAAPRVGTGSSGSGCPGSYVTRAGFRDTSGSLTWAPPSGATRVEITDITANRPAGYSSSVAAAVGLTQVACGSNSASYNILSTTQRFSFTIYVNSLGTTPPANWTGPIILRVDWY